MKVLAVGAQKGGVGKSTSSLYLAARAAELLGGTAERSVVGLLDRDEAKNLSELVALRPDLLLPGVNLLEGEELPAARMGLQLVIVDTPPGFKATASLRESHMIVVPVLPEDQGIANLIKYLRNIEEQRLVVSPGMRLVALLPTMVEPRRILHQARMDDIRAIAADHHPTLSVLTPVQRRARIGAYDLRAPDYDQPAKELFDHAGITSSVQPV
jgi:cellulose biosynthesis protein BcsQ